MIILLQEQLLHKIPQLPSLLCELRAAIFDFILISWLFFKTGGRNEFLTPKYPISRSTQRAQTSLAEADHYSHIVHCKNVEATPHPLGG